MMSWSKKFIITIITPKKFLGHPKNLTFSNVDSKTTYFNENCCIIYIVTESRQGDVFIINFY